MPPSRRLFVQAAAGISAALAGGSIARAADVPLTITGKVIRLAEVVAKAGGKLDGDANPFWLGLRAEDGKIYPLVKDGGSRLFFNDATLLNRPMRLQGRLVPGSTLLRVAQVNSMRGRQLFELYYWCDICSIKRGEKMICECCGGPMDLHEEKVNE